jgi:hypothetical protein
MQHVCTAALGGLIQHCVALVIGDDGGIADAWVYMVVYSPDWSVFQTFVHKRTGVSTVGQTGPREIDASNDIRRHPRIDLSPSFLSHHSRAHRMIFQVS